MTLDPRSWREYAEGLGVDQRRTVEHDCGPGKKLIVSRNRSGYSAWCFRCGEGGFLPGPKETLAQQLQRLKAQTDGDLTLAGVGCSLPAPAVRRVDDWPDGARLWLYRAGLGRAEIGRLGVFWHAGSDRVVLPVFAGSEAVFWQARAYQPGRTPKYIGPTPRPARLLVKYGSANEVTLTEDILSAIKVGMVGEGLALTGTKLSPFVLGYLIDRRCRVNIATDPDATGVEASKKIAAQLRAYGVQHRVLRFAKDPKLHSLAEIKEVLQWTRKKTMTTPNIVKYPQVFDGVREGAGLFEWRQIEVQPTHLDAAACITSRDVGEG